MYYLFSARPSSRGVIKNGSLNNHMQRQNAMLQKVIDFKRSNNAYVPSNNIIVTLLMSLPSMDNTSLFDYYFKLKKNEDAIANGVGFTNYESAGKEHYGNLYNCHEVFIQDRSDILYTDIANISSTNWYLLEPVKTLKLPLDISALQAPGYIGSSHPSSDDVAVFYVNISLLGLMWYQFSVINDMKSPAEQESVETFVGKYVYASAMKNNNDIKIVDIFHAATLGTELSIKNPAAVSYVKDYIADDKEAWNEVIDILESTSLTIGDFLYMCPSYNGGSLISTLPYVGDLLGSNNYWTTVLLLTRYAEVMWYFVGLNGDTSELENKMKVVARAVKGNSTLSKIPDNTVKFLTKLQYEVLLNA